MKNDEKKPSAMPVNRRTFLGAALTATGSIALGLHRGQSAPPSVPAVPSATGLPTTLPLPKKPVDKVMLGKSGLRVSVVGIGTGTIGSGHASNQTRLGDAEFTQLMRHSFDNGITLFDLADSYGSNQFFSRAMQGVPRDQYVIQTKTDNRDPQSAKDDIDRFLRELNTDYIDSVLIHCVTENDWTTRYRGVMDVLEEARQAGKIRAHGVSCHSFVALQAAEASDWVQTHLVRWNARRSHMDADVETARDLFTQMRRKGQGLIGMKVMGEGQLVRGANAMQPEECLRFQIESGVTHAFIVGVESTAQVDQMLRGTQQSLNELGYRAV